MNKLTLVELESLNSSFSSAKFSILAFRAYPLVELRQNIRGKPSDSRQQYLSQQYHTPPPLLFGREQLRSLLTLSIRMLSN